MTKTQLQEIFKNPYNTQTWQQTLNEVFGATELLRRPESLDNGTNERVEGFELGAINSPDGYLIGLFEFEIKKKHNLAMNRVGLRGLVKSFLKYHIDAALVVYYNDKEWRLSFISDLDGNKEKTAPRRFTYLFGSESESYRTPVERFMALHDSHDYRPCTFEAIREAFSVEKLGKDFFKGYKERYKKFVDHIGDNKENRDYAKKLLGRLVFLQFVQKKGWLGGDYAFLRNLFATTAHKDDFLERVLEPLFFDTLNSQRKDDIASAILGAGVKIPYLNGGLFEKDDLDNGQHAFPAEYFEELLDFFGQYNFTIDENDPNDAEVGIDPEMLGHIFENLLEDNKDKGAFYTPKEIVQYMSRESLSQYLKSHTDKALHPYIDQLINRHEVAVELQNPKVAGLLNTLLKNVKICDPAIGSGAFPMGVLNEIFAVRKLLFGHLGCLPAHGNIGNSCSDRNFNAADVKKEIIQNNIYGVDIEQGAVDIARLRFWLSLVVDEDVPQPLPNLDYKIMQGNSLLESFERVDLSFFKEKGSVTQGALDFGGAAQTQSEIKELIKEYFAVTDHHRKISLRNEIDTKVLEHIKLSCTARPDIAEKLNAINPTNRPFFLWHVYFNDVFERGGFDIVIANPPYIQMQLNGGALSEQLKDAGYKTFARTGDIYCLFYEKGIQILKDGGIECFITSNKWMRAGYGEKLRKYLAENNPLLLIDLGAGIFESATVDTNILMVQKSANKKCLLASTYSERDFKNISFSPMSVNEGNIWTILSPMEQGIKHKIETIGTPLKDWDIAIYRGVLTGYNEAFIIDTAKRDELISADPRSEEIIKPILRGRDIKRYSADWAGLWLINSHNGVREKRIPPININDYHAIKAHLDSHWAQIEKRQDQGNTPYNLRNCAYIEEFEKEKIIFQEMVQESSFCFDNGNHIFCVDTGRIITGSNLKYLMSLLNSKLFFYGMKHFYAGGGLGETGIRMKHTFMNEFPLPKIHENDQQPILELADKILEAKRLDPVADTSALESEIDRMVYALYNLTPDEIAIIEM